MVKLINHVQQMHNVARQLMPYTFPKVSFLEEQDVMILKQRLIEVDGYLLNVLYSEADYEDCLLRSIQIQSAVSPFLPFNIVCKVGKAFIGDKNLSFVEFYRNNRKVYCWTIKVKDGEILPAGKTSKISSFEGFEFRVLRPDSIDLY